MSIAEAKKQQIYIYLLEKMEAGEQDAVRKTADNFGITPATVYKYIDALIQNGVVEKIKRGRYRLICKHSQTLLRRSAGEIENETAIYDRCFKPMLAGLPSNVLGIWEYVFTEMVNNVIDHSGAETLTITAARDYLGTTLLLKDDGIGIFEKIRAFLSMETVNEAVPELFKGKMTTDSAHHSGEGIFFSSRLADTFIIFSSGLIFTHNPFDADNLQSLPEAELFGENLQGTGTALYIRLSNHSGKQAKNIFDIYADPDGGFTKTRIAVRNYFDASPISRSQAKRLCARLDRFLEIELDFSGVEWMGQGFAHELFVVFRSQHPDIQIIPLEMSQPVQQMYHHVIEE